jgi:hypothetical protein
MSNSYGELSSEEVEALKNKKSLVQSDQGTSITQENVELTTEPKLNQSFADFVNISRIPSKNLFYPVELQGQALKINDCIILNGIDADNNHELFNEVFLRRIKGIHPDDILVCDEMYIALWLRYTAFPSKPFPGLPYTCTHCHTNIPLDMSEFYFDEMSIEVPDLDELWEKYKLHGGKLLVTLPNSKEEVFIVPRKRGHKQRIKRFVKNRLGNQEVDKVLDFKLKMAVVIDMPGDLANTLEWMDNLDLEDFTYLKSNIDKYSVVSSLPKIEGQCPSCQEVTPIPGYVFQGSLYLPTDKL